MQHTTIAASSLYKKPLDLESKQHSVQNFNYGLLMTAQNNHNTMQCCK